MICINFEVNVKNTYSKFLPVVAGYRILSLSFLFGSTMKTALAVSGIPCASFSSGSIISNSEASSRRSSAIMG